MESMTNCSTLILDPPSVHIGLEDDKLYFFCKPDRECASHVIDDNNQLNKMERMESKTDRSTLILDPSVPIGYDKVYCSCSCNPDRKTVCQECIKAIQLHLNKMAGMESKTDYSTLILDPPVHPGVDVKLCKPIRKTMCGAALSLDENNLMVSKIHINSHLKKMVGVVSVTQHLDLCLNSSVHHVEKSGNLYMCEKCDPLPDALSHRKQKDENNLTCSKFQIQSQLNKMAEMESVPDWSDLLTELLAEIAVKLSLFEDFMAFRGVCTSWRAAATKDKFVSVSKVPLLMLAEKDGDGDVREFYSLCKGKVVTRMSVPEVKEKRCIGAGFGWILTVATSGGELNLVKPMSSSKINVPNMKTFPDYEECRPEQTFIVGQVALSANPSETSDFVLMVANYKTLGFWRKGDSHWTKVEGTQGGFAKISFYRQKMYAIRQDGSIWIWNPYLNRAPEILLTLDGDLQSYYLELSYFVESSKGELLLIMRMSPYRSEPEDYFKYFGIVQIDTVNGKYTEIDTLDQDAIFIGPNSGAVSADEFPGVIKANCVYFTDDDCEQWPYPHNEEEYTWRPLPGTDMGIYHVENGITERLDVESFSSICPPLWIFPSL